MSAAATAADPDFTLPERLGRTWVNECVSFPLSDKQLAAARAGKALVAADGQSLAYQVSDMEAGTPKILFVTDLGPYETRQWRLGDGPKPPATDLQVEDTADAVRITNARTGIAVRKKLSGTEGPILGVKLASGGWAGGSRLSADPAPASYSTKILSRGPAMAEVQAKAQFADGSSWTAVFRMFASEPVVLVDETSAVKGTAELAVCLSLGLAPDRLLFRTGKGQLGKNLTWKIEPGEVHTLEPWLRWWMQDRQGNCFGLFKADGPDLLGVGAREAGAWVDLDLPRESQAPPRGVVVREGDEVRMTLPLRHGRRKWMFMALPRQDATKDLEAEGGFTALPHNRLVIKHGHFPLDLVKDYVLAWKHDGKPHPRVLIKPADVERFRKTADRAEHEKAIPRYLADPNPLNQFSMEGPILAWLATGDQKLGEHLAKGVSRMLGDVVETLFEQPRLSLGSAPHHFSSIGAAMTLADVVLSRADLDPVERERILARAAFIGYTVDRPEFWSPARGFAANPNMTTSVYGYKTAIGCLLASHPRAAEWVRDGLAELESQLDGWSDANGGWLEAPHYAMVSYDQILAALLMARNAGFADHLHSPRMKNVISWFGKISTPPDSRLGGWRHMPPIGNTYIQEPSGEFGIVAALWKEQDPEFASAMQWMWRQQGSFPQPGIGGAFPGIAGFRSLLTDPSISEKPPAWGSELFPETGVVFRHGFPSGRETMLHMIAGKNHDHYDDDSGSITLWGKGRILADDFGYTGMGPRNDHSMVDTAIGGGRMAVTEFKAGERLDYVSGVSGGWTRQIAFVKDPNPRGPAWFLMSDALAVPADATWRLWCTAAAVKPEGRRARVEGREDVDLDVCFLRPAGISVTTEEKKHQVMGLNEKQKFLRVEPAQTGLIATAKGSGFTTVLFPRLKTEQPPEVVALAEGRGVKVTSAAGTDYVFLAPKAFAFRDGDVEFEGRAAAVQVRGGQPFFSLAAPGRIAYRGKEAKEGSVGQAEPDNRVENGNFESGTQDLFPAESGNVVVALHHGNPATGDAKHPGEFCVAITSKKADSNVGMLKPIFVDASKTYRIGVSIHAPAALAGTIGGYGKDATNANLTDAAGRVWQWYLAPKGPAEGWQTLETTVGPAGSGAAHEWPAGILSTGFTFWMAGLPAGGTVYLDDISVVEIDGAGANPAGQPTKMR